MFTDKQDTLSNDFFVNLLDMNTKWHPTTEEAFHTEGRDRTTGASADRASRTIWSWVELATAGPGEVYAADDAQEKFVRDFCGRDKVAMLDRFEVEQGEGAQERPHRSGFAGPSEPTRVHRPRSGPKFSRRHFA